MREICWFVGLLSCQSVEEDHKWLAITQCAQDQQLVFDNKNYNYNNTNDTLYSKLNKQFVQWLLKKEPTQRPLQQEDIEEYEGNL